MVTQWSLAIAEAFPTSDSLEGALVAYLSQFAGMTNGEMMNRISGFTIVQLRQQIKTKLEVNHARTRKTGDATWTEEAG